MAMFQDDDDYLGSGKDPGGFGEYVPEEGAPEGFIARGRGVHRRPVLKSYDYVLLNTSSGKDSQEMMRVAVEEAKRQGAFDRLIAVHCDLGRCEWAGSKELAEEQALHYGLPFRVVVKERDILENALYKYHEHHSPEGLARYKAKGKKPPPEWPSQAYRWCTSEHKTAQVDKLMTKLKVGSRREGKRVIRFLNVLGLRAQESDNRGACKTCHNAQTREELKGSARTSKKWIPRSECWVCGGTGDRAELYHGDHNTERWVDEWLPVLGRTEDEIWKGILDSGVPHHTAYDLGMPRLSCCFCIFAPKSALVLAGHYNKKLLKEYVAVEKEVHRTFLQTFSLAEILEEVEHGAPLEEIRAKVMAQGSKCYLD